ncbi:unnamed protein product [Gongylonema pulchrum]|uniref:Uncharacterized protein n=1 Tax=Gongylonema pulchrum TaxID=637853 RepID=A0A183EJZ9_9BILA|nr:unnamed protein product [Gongylonema pulchrum]
MSDIERRGTEDVAKMWWCRQLAERTVRNVEEEARPLMICRMCGRAAFDERRGRRSSIHRRLLPARTSASRELVPDASASSRKRPSDRREIALPAAASSSKPSLSDDDDDDDSYSDSGQVTVPVVVIIADRNRDIDGGTSSTRRSVESILGLEDR